MAGFIKQAVYRTAAIMAVAIALAMPAAAQKGPPARVFVPNYHVAPPLLRPTAPHPPAPLLTKIRPSQAAALAKRSVPGSSVVGVKLLPSGDYAVTLRTDTDVSRVIVSGEDGSVQ
jgi:hypothetical protein